MHGVTQSALLKALGWSLFDSLWQMALLWLLYFLLVSFFRKMAAHSRHGLAILLLGLGAAVSVFSFITHYNFITSHDSAAAVAPSTDIWPGSIGFAAASIDALLPYGSIIYLFALVFLFARCVNVYFHSRRLRSEGLYKMDPLLRVFVAQTAYRLGIKKEVGVWLSSLVDVPLTLGFLRPVILLPFAMISKLSPQQVEAVLLHELAHIKRYDYLLNLGVTILQFLFFFNPFVRLLIRDIRREREHRCDDLVIQLRVDPFTYASALLSLATTSRRREILALAATGKNDRLLLRRVQRIMQQDHEKDLPGARPVAFFLLTILAAMITLTRPAADPVVRPAISARIATPSSTFNGMFAKEPAPPAPLKKNLAILRKRSAPKPAALIATDAPGRRPSASWIEQDDQLPDQGMSADMTGQGAMSIQVNHMIPVEEDTTLSGHLLATLTDGQSSAGEVRANIVKALAANKVALRKIQAALNASLRAMGQMPTPDQTARPEQRIERRSLEEQLKFQQQHLLLQQNIRLRLETAVKKLAIVYI